MGAKGAKTIETKRKSSRVWFVRPAQEDRWGREARKGQEVRWDLSVREGLPAKGALRVPKVPSVKPAPKGLSAQRALLVRADP